MALTREQEAWVADKMAAETVATEAADAYKIAMEAYVGERVEAEHVMDAAIERAKSDYETALVEIDSRHKELVDAAKVALIDTRIGVAEFAEVKP